MGGGLSYNLMNFTEHAENWLGMPSSLITTHLIR